jgi:hypothetical protein
MYCPCLCRTGKPGRADLFICYATVQVREIQSPQKPTGCFLLLLLFSRVDHQVAINWLLSSISESCTVTSTSPVHNKKLKFFHHEELISAVDGGDVPRTQHHQVAEAFPTDVSAVQRSLVWYWRVVLVVCLPPDELIGGWITVFKQGSLW